MNYLYANGNIHVFDDQDNKKVIDYTDNFKSRLILENNLESIEKILNDNDEQILDLESKIGSERIENLFRTLCFGEVGYIFPFFANRFLSYDFGNLKEGNLPYLFALVGILCGTKISLNVSELKKCKQILKGRVKVREELVMRYNLEKMLYNKLLEDDSRENEEIYNDDRIKFQKMKLEYDFEEGRLNQCYKSSLYYGTNKKIYHKYYKRGTLEEELKKYLPSSEIELITQYIEEENERKILKKKLKK